MLLLIGVSAVLMIGLNVFLSKAKIGKAMRAAASDRETLWPLATVLALTLWLLFWRRTRPRNLAVAAGFCLNVIYSANVALCLVVFADRRLQSGYFVTIVAVIACVTNLILLCKYQPEFRHILQAIPARADLHRQLFYTTQ